MSAKKNFLLILLILSMIKSYSFQPDYTSIYMDISLKELDITDSRVINQQQYPFYFNKISSKITPDTPYDILNWLDSDLGLLSTGYNVTSCKIENDHVITEYTTVLSQPVFKVHKITDKSNQILKVIMYSSETEVFSSALINNRAKIKTHTFPSGIKTDYYEEGKIKYTFQLDFKNIKTDIPEKNIAATYKLVKLEQPFSITSNDVPSDNYSYTSPQKEFNTTTSKILVDGAYSFYKNYITEQDLSGCSYYPSCSSYMRTAVSKYGITGIIMGLERLHRCTHVEKRRKLYPLSPRGFQLDYVK